MDHKKILNAAEQCIQDEPVFCSNDCPLHVNVRLMMEKVQQGDFTGAFKHYQKQVMFPEIISRVCDEPCQRACIRKEMDGPLSIRRIEKACVDFSQTKGVNQFAVSGKNKQAGIVGGGLSGLSCAVNLARKGYQVKLFEQSDFSPAASWGPPIPPM